jgi:hypothetical protein
MKNNVIKPVLILLVLVLVVAIGFYIRNNLKLQREILKKCPDLAKFDIQAAECFGSIVIEDHPDDATTNYLLFDFKNLSVIAGINKKEAYKVIGNMLFVIDETSHSTGTLESNLVVIDVNTGEVRRYKTIDDVPSQNKVVFQELEKSK